MTHIRILAAILALAVPGANAIQPAASADEVRERLRAFGQVCRVGERCPGQSADAASQGGASNWTVVDSVDEPPEQAVTSRWALSGIQWPETSASIALSPGMGSSMRFTYLNLDGGEESRYGAWINHSMTLAVGEREQEFQVKQPAKEPQTLLLGLGPSLFVRQALKDGAGETLRVRLNYRDAGPAEFLFPLDGAAESLHAIGILDEAALAAMTRAAGGETETSAPAAEAPAPAALTAGAGPRSGQQIYDTFCFACHATGVSEAPLFGSLAEWQPRIDKGMDTLVATSLTGFDLMPPMGTCMTCSEDEMRDAIQYMIDTAQ